MSGFAPRRKQVPVEYWNADVGGNAFVFGGYGRGRGSADERNESAHRGNADGGSLQVLFSLKKLVSGVARGTKTGELRAIVDGLRDQIVRRTRWPDGDGFFDQLIIRRLIGTKRAG